MFCPDCRGVWLDRTGVNKILQQYTSERLRVMKRYDDLFSSAEPQINIPEEFQSLEERRQQEIRRLEEIQFDPDFEEKPKGRAGIINDIFNIFDEP